MKPLIFTALAVLTFVTTTPSATALFGHVTTGRERRQHTEQQVTRERQTSGHLYVDVSVLSAGIIVALVIGAAVGSQAKEHYES